MTAGLLTVTREPAAGSTQLRDDWLDLEGRASPTVFLSWQWLGHWLHVYQPHAWVLRVIEGERLVGLGLVVETDERRHGVMKSRCLRLHQTGHKLLDQIWIEYNGFLAEHGKEDAVAEACLQYLCNSMPDWDEFVIGAIDAEEAERYARITGLHKHLRWEAPCFGVDLDHLRRTGGRYLDTLSRNTRHQIKRCYRLYQQQGDVRLVRPDSVEEALALFDRIGPRHLERWGAGPDQSGFANPDFVRFHRELIRFQWPDGGVDLVSLMAGDKEIASFYNLVYNQVVYFYLGGMEAETDNRLKPGLLGHSLCIEDYRHHGFHYYDFMGGDERYKSNLGHLHRHLVQISLQRARFKLKLEDVARRARNRWIGEAGDNHER
ncbi:GNAT family N-acetyltransferase [Marinobacter salsuginis]|uniref:GNAT family N-acetyltransferase n=1 Tax=Marinobacter salsuginis TaxID=418719 RepID=UPI001C95C135|nr:GNAT family N-acetyltransferase [Marinobacter salsuginis]MBY6070323.1 GNAT family N-acetyltransferase [Marinobacter salsuginis]